MIFRIFANSIAHLPLAFRFSSPPSASFTRVFALVWEEFTSSNSACGLEASTRSADVKSRWTEPRFMRPYLHVVRNWPFNGRGGNGYKSILDAGRRRLGFARGLSDPPIRAGCSEAGVWAAPSWWVSCNQPRWRDKGLRYKSQEDQNRSSFQSPLRIDRCKIKWFPALRNDTSRVYVGNSIGGSGIPPFLAAGVCLRYSSRRSSRWRVGRLRYRL